MTVDAEADRAARRRTYCTLYDTAYSVNGLLMISSLLEHATRESRVYALCLDREAAHRTLRWAEQRGEARVTVIMLDALLSATPGLEAARANRPHREFCWTAASAFTKHVMSTATAIGSAVAYCDADLWWFSDPEICWQEMGAASIGIHEHRFPARAPQGSGYTIIQAEEKVASSGRFNVGFVGFRYDVVALQCLARWSKQVLDRCDAGTCGDQKYLDEWPAHFGVWLHVYESPGVGVATWNVWGYDVRPGTPPTVDGAPTAFYHFHEHRRTPEPSAPAQFRRTLGYPLRPVDIATFYEPYERAYLELERQLETPV